MGDMNILTRSVKVLPEGTPRPSYKFNRPSSSYEIKIINTTKDKIYVANRLGLNQLVEPISLHKAYTDYFREAKFKNLVRPGIYITVYMESIAYTHGVLDTSGFDLRNRLNYTTDENMRELSTNMGVINEGIKKGCYSEICFFVSQEELDSFHGQFTYLDEADLYISTDLSYHMPPHLFSKEGKPMQLERIPFEDYTRKGAGLTLVNVDNSGKYGKLYYYLAGKVWCLHPVKDISRPDGVYLYETCDTSSQPKWVSENCVDPNVTFGTHDDWLAGKFMIQLCRTESEALLDEEKLKQRVQELTLQKQKLEEQLKTQELAIKQLELKSQQEDIRHEQKVKEAKMEAKLASQKHQYEQIKERRKDKSDFWKTAMTVVSTVVAGIFSLVKIMERVRI